MENGYVTFKWKDYRESKPIPLPIFFNINV
ncbi:hypothetical protein K2F43_20025 [Clostridium estertheticum]|nr:hypothetical protein [Clostridium estertheticum]